MTKINTMMYISSIMLLLFITMKINSSGKERSHKLLQANYHISLLFMVFFNDVYEVNTLLSAGLSRSLSFFFSFLFLSFGLLFVFCSSNVSIDEGMFGFSIGASKIGLGEFTDSNGPACDDAISGLGGSGLVVVRCLQNMALSIMTKL